jgi:conjugative transfer region protein TrbK
MLPLFKNWRFINWGCVGPLLASVAVVVGLIAGVIALARHDRHVSPVPVSQFHAQSDSALSRELVRCQNIGDVARSDRGCLAAWAENRRRFFETTSERPAR